MNKCKNCNIGTTNAKFCTKSCSVTYNNHRRSSKRKTYSCLECGKECTETYQKRNKYCSILCQGKFEYNQFIEEWLLTGYAKNSRRLKRYILEQQDNKCAHCGVQEWNGKPLVLELEHKDGNGENNHRDNLECLCPNCHSQTPTYKNRNKGNGRHARRKRYAEGKSY